MNDTALVNAFMKAYREIDLEGMATVLAANARVRLVMPKGVTELVGAEALVSALRQFATMWKTEEVDAIDVELLAENKMKTGRMVFVSQRFRLRGVAGDARANMVVKHLLALADGRVALVDELCSGVMPG